MKNFETAARRGDASVANPIDIEFQLDGKTLTATPPTTGQLALFIGANGKGGLKSVNALFNFLSAILNDDDYAVIEEALQEGVEITVLTDIIGYLVGEWSDRPTSRSSASSASRKTTGKTSTVKRATAAKKA